MKLLTFISLEEIAQYARLTDAAINDAKKKLAYEVTAIVHGHDVADQAQKQAQDLFEDAGRSDTMPRTAVSSQQIAAGISLLDVLLEAKVIPSKGEGRRLMQQNGIYLNGEAISDVNRQLVDSDFTDGEAIVRKGKKIYHAIKLIG